jgi:hypothetical protein
MAVALGFSQGAVHIPEQGLKRWAQRRASGRGQR